MSSFKLTALALLLPAGLSASVAYANPLTLGASVIYSQSPYKGGEGRYYPVPVINYDGDSVYFRSLQAGYYLWKDSQDELSLTVLGSPQNFNTDDTKNKQLKKLDNRHMTLMGGLAYRHVASWGIVRTVLAGDMLGNSNGYQWDLAWLYRFEMGDFTLTPGIGALYSSSNQNDYYYGVSKSESLRSGIGSYDADDSWSPYLEMTAMWSISQNWNASLSGRYTRLSSEIKNSPMVDREAQLALWTGVSYTF